MYVPEIIEMKEKLDYIKNQGLILSWELPYENLLTRLNAAIFFVAPTSDEQCDKIWELLSTHENLSYRLNKEQKLSKLKWRVTFNAEEKKADEAKAGESVLN